MATTYHAEHVGSLLRPPYLLRAREAHETGELTTAQLHEVEDRAVAELLVIQKRAGGFEPLRFVPPGPTVVLGLVTTKVPQLETRDDLLRRIDEAARYAPLEQLALSPQCGFASGSLGNLITVDDERRKLDLVVSVAGQVWG
jgi:methionine synthase II (cobalamin-independent)